MALSYHSVPVLHFSWIISDEKLYCICIYNRKLPENCGQKLLILAGCWCSGLGTGWGQRRGGHAGSGARGIGSALVLWVIQEGWCQGAALLWLENWIQLVLTGKPWVSPASATVCEKMSIAQIMWHYRLYYLRQMSLMFFRLHGLMMGHTNVYVQHWRLNLIACQLSSILWDEAVAHMWQASHATESPPWQATGSLVRVLWEHIARI